MNPIFIFLVLLIGFLVWLLGSFLYRPIGKIIQRIIWNSQDAMDKDEEERMIDEIVKKEMEERKNGK